LQGVQLEAGLDQFLKEVAEGLLSDVTAEFAEQSPEDL
jgi:hypothetical protein